MKKALITGITGQDGSYLAEFLLDKGYEVHGIVRRSSLCKHRPELTTCWSKNAVKLHDGDLSDSSGLVSYCWRGYSRTRSTIWLHRAMCR